jgi:hypothetical protein
MVASLSPIEDMTPLTLVYIVYGPDKYFQQARFSLLTLLHLIESAPRGTLPLRVAVWSTRPGCLPKHSCIRHERIDPRIVSAWRGPLDFVHRAKIAALQHVASSTEGRWLFVDTDTRWMRLPDEEFLVSQRQTCDGKPVLVMSCHEGELSQHYHPAYYAMLRRLDPGKLATLGVGVPPWPMWNTGVLGGHGSWLPDFYRDALVLNDALLPWLRPRLYVEQLAISLLADQRCDVRLFEGFLDHYWDCSFEASIYLENFFALTRLMPALPLQAEMAFHLDWDKSLFRRMQKQPRYRFRRWRSRVVSSLGKRKNDLNAARLRRSSIFYPSI